MFQIFGKYGNQFIFYSFRSEIDKGRYERLDNCQEASLLTSTFKLFLREMETPLIAKDARDRLYDIISKEDETHRSQDNVSDIRKILHHALDLLSFETLKYLIYHLKIIADVKGKYRYKNYGQYIRTFH